MGHRVGAAGRSTRRPGWTTPSSARARTSSTTGRSTSPPPCSAPPSRTRTPAAAARPCWPRCPSSPTGGGWRSGSPSPARCCSTSPRRARSPSAPVGYRTVRRVRLLHACVRALLLLGDAAGNPWPTGGPRPPHQPAGHAGHAIGVHHCGIRRNHAARLSHEQSRQAGLSAPLERCRPLSRHHRSGSPGRSRGGEAAHPAARGVAAGNLAVGQGADADAPRRHVRADAPPAAHAARRARAQARGPRGGRPAGRAAQPAGARRGRRRRLRAARVPRPTIGRWTLRLPSRLLGRALIGHSIAEGTGAADPAYLWPDQWLELERG